MWWCWHHNPVIYIYIYLSIYRILWREIKRPSILKAKLIDHICIEFLPSGDNFENHKSTLLTIFWMVDIFKIRYFQFWFIGSFVLVPVRRRNFTIFFGELRLKIVCAMLISRFQNSITLAINNIFAFQKVPCSCHSPLIYKKQQKIGPRWDAFGNNSFYFTSINKLVHRYMRIILTVSYYANLSYTEHKLVRGFISFWFMLF